MITKRCVQCHGAEFQLLDIPLNFSPFPNESYRKIPKTACQATAGLQRGSHPQPGGALAAMGPALAGKVSRARTGCSVWNARCC